MRENAKGGERTVREKGDVWNLSTPSFNINFLERIFRKEKISKDL